MKNLSKTILAFSFILFVTTNIYAQLPDKTIVTPYLNTKIPSDTNVIYCSTFQIAWNELKETVGGDVKLQGQPPIADSLNKGENAKEYINPRDYFIASGVVTEKLIQNINKTLNEKFNGVFEPVNDKPNPNNYVFYAFLNKQLEFKYEFNDITNGSYFKKQKVIAFGIDTIDTTKTSHLNIFEQIEIYVDTTKRNAYIIKIIDINGDEIILSSNHRETIKESIEFIEVGMKTFMKITSSQIHLLNGLSIKIPAISFDIDYSINDLIGKKVLNKKAKEFMISEANQKIMFNLNRKGAFIKSEAKIKLSKGGMSSINFNKPFFVMLREKNQDYPYLAVWVANENIMIKQNED